jgi:hypothetical protein
VQFAVAKFNKLRTQYLDEIIYWRVEIKKVLVAVESDANTAAVQLLMLLTILRISRREINE